MKKQIELTVLQFIGVILGSAAGIVFFTLWITGALYQYGI